jgi:two-component system CheB/CheR fusion protein
MTGGRAPPVAAFPVVGIGASAGGLDAMVSLLAALPDDTGMAYVFVQHLDPTQPSRLAEALSRATAMPVVEASDGLRLVPDRVVVGAPGADIALVGGVLRSTAPPSRRQPLQGVDHFLRSLAEAAGARAIGVVLSGSGSDGTEGLRAIRAAGGITFAQDVASARFPSMPGSAMAAGVVDHCLPVDGIAGELLRLARHPYFGAPTAGGAAGAERRVAGDEPFQAILTLVRSTTGVDLGGYKATTVRRRLARRLALRGVADLAGYLAVLERDPAEVHALFDDMLIHVTSFFRDRELYDAVAQLVPTLVKNKETTALRVWVPGCSTGEEVYSMAITLLDALARVRRTVSLQIFGSDVSERAIAVARTAVYPDAQVAHLDRELLARHFVRVDGGYRVGSPARDVCVFVRHDVTRDPPFSKMDVISCRNLLIYFAAPLQRKVLAIAHYALVRNGILILGRTESIGSSKLFVAAGAGSPLFRRTQVAAGIPLPAVGASGGTAPLPLLPPPLVPPEPRVQRQVDALLLRRYGPAGVVVDAHGDILDFRGRTGRYLEQPPGSPATNLFRLARDGLALELRGAFDRARSQRVVVRREGLQVGTGATVQRFHLEVVPLPATGDDEPRFLVVFEDAPASPTPRASGRRTTRAGPDRAELESQLEATRVYMQSLVEELERAAVERTAVNDELVTTNEELQSTNEELQSTNEELQSTNEELESAKEEMATVNDDLHAANRQLGEVNADLVNVLASLDLPMLLLSRDGRIRRFTPQAQLLLSLLPGDVGRPLADLFASARLPGLEHAIREVLDSDRPYDVEVVDVGNRWHRLQARPYRTADGLLDGVVLSLVDIDTLRHAVSAAERAGAYAEAIVDAMPVSVLTVGRGMKVEAGNAAFYATFRTTAEQTVGSGFFAMDDASWFAPGLEAALVEVARTGHPGRVITVDRVFPRIGHRVIEVHASPIEAPSGGTALLLVLDDATERVARDRERADYLARTEGARSDAEQANRSKDLFLATLSHELRTPLTSILMSAQLLQSDDGTAERTRRAGRLIERNARVQAQLVADLLDVSRIAAGRLRLDMETVDLGAVVVAAIEAVHATASAAQLRVDSAVPLDRIVVRGDAVRLQQMAWNLLSNAIKATPPGGTISVELTGDRTGCRLRVTDTGRGIGAEFLPRLFGAFTQEDSSTTRTRGGLGLGLAIVQAIVTAHGGTVSAHSDGPGSGATFTVDLPAAPGEARDAGARTRARTAGSDLSGLDVLVVEDDDATRDVIALVLVDAGARVRTASSAEAGVDEVTRRAPDVLVSDLAMPVEDGFVLLDRVRATAGAGAVRAIAVSALASDDDRRRSLDAGFNAHLSKPVDIAELTRAVARVAGRSVALDGS